MINIKAAASLFAAAAVTATTIQKIVNHRKVEKMVEELYEEIDKFGTIVSPEIQAFHLAQDVLSDRMLAGYYDDKTDEQVRHDYDVLYANFLKK